jgi:hypothetical protein
VQVVTISFDDGDDGLVVSKSSIENLTIQDADTNLKKSLVNISEILSPEEPKHNKRYSKDSYDSEEIKDKVPVADFVPMPYQDENSLTHFACLDLTGDQLKSESDMSSCWGV